MAIIKQDNFSSASVPETLAARTSPGYGGYQGDTLTWEYVINPSGVLLTTSDDRATVFGDESPTTTDYETIVTGTVGGTASAGQQIGAMVRGSGAGATRSGYFAWLNGVGDIAIERYNANVITTITGPSVFGGFNLTTEYDIKLRATGTNPVVLQMYIDDVLVLSADDSAAERIQTAGNGGIYSRYNNTRSQVTNLLIQDLTDAGIINGGVTIAININASMQHAVGASLQVTGSLVNTSGVPITSLSSIAWAWFDVWGSAATDTGTTSTDANGDFAINIPNTTLIATEYGYLALEHVGQGLIGLYKLQVS